MIHAANPGRPPFVIEDELPEDLRSVSYTSFALDLVPKGKRVQSGALKVIFIYFRWWTNPIPLNPQSTRLVKTNQIRFSCSISLLRASSASMSAIAHRTDSAISSLLRTSAASWNPKSELLYWISVSINRLSMEERKSSHDNLYSHLTSDHCHRRHFFNVTLLIRWPIGQRKLLNKNQTSWIKLWRRAQKLGILLNKNSVEYKLLSFTE